MGSLDHIVLPERDEPFTIYLPAPTIAYAFVSFSEPSEWLSYISSLDLHPAIPLIVRAKYQRAQKLYYIGWIDGDLIKAAELVALTALELALRDCYGGRTDLDEVRQANPKSGKRKKSNKAAGQPPKLSDLCHYMVKRDGLKDEDIPLVRRCGGSVVKALIGETRPSLYDRRNDATHGDPFDGLPTAGLIETIRDLIEYAYRDWIKNYVPMAIPEGAIEADEFDEE
jgi:hypothetical protein